jgi:hypothetical protein
MTCPSAFGLFPVVSAPDARIDMVNCHALSARIYQIFKYNSYIEIINI